MRELNIYNVQVNNSESAHYEVHAESEDHAIRTVQGGGGKRGHRQINTSVSAHPTPVVTTLPTEAIAKVAHNINKAYCEAIGDTSQVDWDAAPDWQKESAVDGVEAHLKNPDLTPEQSHIAWMNHKRTEGWVYGPHKDQDKKTHPCMVPYSELPQEQRAKDYIFKAVVENLEYLV